jgi:hypothetical protein
MNSEKKPWRWEKWKEERNLNRFLERNGEDRQQRALVSHVFSSLLFHSPSLFSYGEWIRKRGYCSMSTVEWARYPNSLKKVITFLIQTPNTTSK